MRSYDGESSSCEEDERREPMPEAHLQQHHQHHQQHQQQQHQHQQHGPWQRSAAAIAASHPAAAWAAWEQRNTVSLMPFVNTMHYRLH